jgi:hypothetical protein
VGQADRRWASCGPSVTGYRAQEKEYKDEGRQLPWGLKNYQQTYRFIPFFLVKLPSAPSNSPSVLAPIPQSSLPIHVIGLSLSGLLSSVLTIGI